MRGRGTGRVAVAAAARLTGRLRTLALITLVILCACASMLTGAVATAAAADAHITGTVTDAGGVAIADISVTAYRAGGGGWSWTTGVSTGVAGTYDLVVPAGTYRIDFYDNAGVYVEQWYLNKPDAEHATSVTVAAGATASGKDARLVRGGHITGTVKNSGGTGLQGVSVYAYRADGSGGWVYTRAASTQATGAYDLGGLPTGTYRIQFFDNSGAYVQQWYLNQPDRDHATSIPVTAGATTSGRNATLVKAGHITGTVKNAGGTGLQGVSVYAYRADGSGGWVYTRAASTQATGAYDLGGLPTGTYRIQFSDNSGAYIQQWYLNQPDRDHATSIPVTAGSTVAGKNATLVKAGHITGTVKNSGGAALANISVTAYRANGASWDYVGGASTGAAGTYDLGGLPTGTYRIQFSDNSGAYIQQWYLGKPDLEHAISIPVTAGATTSGRNATLVKAGHITGTVKNSGGAALAGISVTAYRADGSGEWDYAVESSTGAAGTYDLGGLAAGTYRLQFSDGSGAYVQQWYLGKPDLEHATSIAVSAGSTVAGKNATLVKAAHITGTVKNAGGAALAGISVTAWRYAGPADWPWAGSATTTAAGAYHIAGLAAGTYRLQFSDGSGAYVQQWYLGKPDLEHATSIAVSAGSTVAGKNATLVKAAHITGTVKNAGGAALANVSVSAYRFDGAGAWSSAGSATTGAAGTYAIGGLAAGTYRIQFYDTTGAYITQWYQNRPDRQHAVDVVVAAGATSTGKNATLAKAGHITGTVKNSGGTPLSGIWATAYRYGGSGAWSSVGSAATGPSGAFDIGRLPTGTYRVQFADNAGAYVPQWYPGKTDLQQAVDVAVTAGATSTGRNATMLKAAHLTGTVTASGGGALGSIYVTAYRRDAQGTWAFGSSSWTNGVGAYDIGGLAGGAYRIQFFDYAGTYVEQWYLNQPDRDHAVTIVLAAGATASGKNAALVRAGRISGTVRNTAAAALPGITVSAYRYDGAGTWDYAGNTSTGTAGTYSLGSLRAGTYRVQFWDGTGQYAQQWYPNQPDRESAVTVSVTAGATVSGRDATLAKGGHVSGTVTDTGGHGLGNVLVAAFRSSSSGVWVETGGARTAASGAYDVGGLPTGTYRIRFSTSAGTFAQQWYLNKPDLEHATSVAVTAGATSSGRNATLVRAGHITGTVRDSSGTGLWGITVYASRYAGAGYWPSAGSTTTTGSGAYDLGGLSAGTYRIQFYDNAGIYAQQWYLNKPDLDHATDITVAVGATTSGRDATLLPQ